MHRLLVLAALTVLALAGCSPASGDADIPPPTDVQTNPPATAAAANQPDRIICEMTGDGATYYLVVTSAADHDFTICTGAVKTFTDIDQLFAVPGVDRRCFLGDSALAQFHASIAAYSDTKEADRAAVRELCDTYP